MKLNKTVTLGIYFLALVCQAACASNPELVPVGNANWTFVGDEVRADAGSGFLVTKDSYGDFKLSVDFFAAEGTNSGVFFRCDTSAQISDQSCYEANIFDLRPDQSYRTGAITTIAAPKAIIHAEDGAWHRYEIFAVGDRIRVQLDGRETVYLRNQSHAAGPVALQLAKGAIRFRNLKIERLGADSIQGKRSALDGVWELESMNIVDRYGNATPWCVGSYGVIMYSNGYMSTAVNCTTDPAKMVLYSGPFKIEGQTVFHHAQNASDPALSRVHSRSFFLRDENHLELSGGLGESKVVVKWVRR